MEKVCCLECKKLTEIVLDHRTGDTICTECGLVLESHYIDECSEWRTFADSTDDNDPSRVGGPINPLLTHGDLSTVINPTTNPNDKATTKKLISTSIRIQNLEKNTDKFLIRGFQVIAGITEKLGLNEMIKNRACEIFSEFNEKKNNRINHLSCFCAACVFMACRELKLSRTFKEISTVADGVSVKNINKACLAIKSSIEIKGTAGSLNAGELVRRFCSNLGMSHHESKAVQETLHIAEEFDIRRNPKTVLAAIIFMTTQISGYEKKSLLEISDATGVAETTIKRCYKDIQPYASSLIPKWFANEEDISSLISPLSLKI